MSGDCYPNLNWPYNIYDRTPYEQQQVYSNHSNQPLLTLEQLEAVLEKLNATEARAQIDMLLEGMTDTQLEIVQEFVHMIKEENYE